MRTCIVSRSYSLRFTDKNDAETYAKCHGYIPCHLLLQNRGLQCTFGYGVYKDDELIGYHRGDEKWL